MMAQELDRRAIWQPLHPSVRPLLDPEYIAFHDEYMQYVQPDQTKPWDGSARTNPSLPPGGSRPVEVGSIEDVVLANCKVRVFTPASQVLETGWPALLWFHGGGWAIGGLNSENDFCAFICKATNCVVVTVDYRLAPEFKYPAPIEDAVEALQWLRYKGWAHFHVDVSRIAIGGTSAGGNLAAVLAMKAPSLCPAINVIFQLLIVPVIDNTADEESVWVNKNAPWLTPARMLWYRKMYVPQERWAEWEASPNYASKQLKEKSPPTFIAVSEQDLLATEALAFAEQLNEAGVVVTTKVYHGCTHSILSLNGKLEKGKLLMNDAAEALLAAFNKTCDSETAT